MSVNFSFFLEIGSRLNLTLQVIRNGFLYYTHCLKNSKLGNRVTFRKQKAWAAYCIFRQSKIESQFIQFDQIIYVCETNYKDVWQLVKRDQIINLAFFYERPSHLVPYYAGLLKLSQMQSIHIHFLVKQIECEIQNVSPQTVIAYAMTLCSSIQYPREIKDICKEMSVSQTSLYRIRRAGSKNYQYKSGCRFQLCCSHMQTVDQAKSSNSEEDSESEQVSPNYSANSQFTAGVHETGKVVQDHVLGGHLTQRGVVPEGPLPKKRTPYIEGYDSPGRLTDGSTGYPLQPIEDPRKRKKKKNEKQNRKTKLMKAFPKAFNLDPVLGEIPSLPPGFIESELLDYSEPPPPGEMECDEPTYEEDMEELASGEKRIKGRTFRLIKRVSFRFY